MLVKTLADKLTTEFASLTTGLDFDIVVTDDIQMYQEDMEIGNKPYIPAVIKVSTSFLNENKFIENVMYEIEFAVKKEYRDSFQDVIISFRNSQVNEIISSQYVSKTTQNVTYVNEETINGIDYMIYSLVLNWAYADAFVGRDVEFYIDNVAIPYLFYQPEHDITYVSNQSRTESYRLTNDLIIMQVPLIFSNAKVLALYNDINSDYYNSLYELKIVTGSVEITKNVALKKGTMQVTKNSGLAFMQLTFETAYPRVSITLDGDTLPVVAYQFNAKKVIESDNRDGEDVVYGVDDSKVRSWTIKFIKNTTGAWTKLEADVYGDTLDISYTLNVGGTDYTVGVSEASESYTETGDIAIEVAFNERR